MRFFITAAGKQCFFSLLVSSWFTQFFTLVLGDPQPAVYPEGFVPVHNGEPKDEVLGQDDTGPSWDRRAAAGGHAVAAACGKKGIQDIDFNMK